MAEGLGRPVKTIKTDLPANEVLLKAASDPMIEAGTFDVSLHATPMLASRRPGGP